MRQWKLWAIPGHRGGRGAREARCDAASLARAGHFKLTAGFFFRSVLCSPAGETARTVKGERAKRGGDLSSNAKALDIQACLYSSAFPLRGAHLADYLNRWLGNGPQVRYGTNRSERTSFFFRHPNEYTRKKISDPTNFKFRILVLQLRLMYSHHEDNLNPPDKPHM